MATDYSEGDTLFAADMDNLVVAAEKNGVLTGWTTVENGTPNMSVNVNLGTGFAGGTYNSTGGDTNVVITASHATLDRIDLIVVNNSGTFSAIAGTPAATPNPPDLPDNSILLAMVDIVATVTAIYNADITARRLLLGSIQKEMIGAGEITNTEIAAGAAIAYSKLNLTGGIVNTDINGAAAIAWSKIAVDSDIVYKNEAETITGLWEHNNTLRMIAGNAINFRLSATTYGKIFASAGKMNIEGVNGGDILIGVGAGDVQMLNTLIMKAANLIQINDAINTNMGKIYGDGNGINLLTNGANVDIILSASGNLQFKGAGTNVVYGIYETNGGSGGPRPETNATGTVGESNAWFEVRACTLSDVCSEFKIPKRALETLETVMLQDIGSKIRDEKGAHVLKSDKLPEFLREKKNGKHMRNVSATISLLLGGIYELLEQNKEADQRILNLEKIKVGG